MITNKAKNLAIAKDIITRKMAEKEVSNFELRQVRCLIDKLQSKEKVSGVESTSLTSSLCRRRTRSGAAL